MNRQSHSQPPHTVPMHHRPGHTGTHRLRWLRGLLGMGLCLALAACGFHLRGVSPLPFNTLYINVSPESAFGAHLRRAIHASSPGTRLVENPEDAEVRLTQLSNDQSLRDISIDARGRVEEYELDLAFTFQLTNAQGHYILAPTTLRATRELPYDPDAVQAKDSEIAALFRNMQQSLVERIVRRLTAPEVTQAYHNIQSQPRETEPASQQQLPASNTTPITRQPVPVPR